MSYPDKNDVYKLPRIFQDTNKLQQSLKNKPESYWRSRGNTMALRLFREMSTRVPAYKDFLAKNRFDPTTVTSIRDFPKIPTINKDNYLRQYPKEALCWDGKFSECNWTVSTTSGSSGEPYYFPRTDFQTSQYALTAELYLRENFHIQEKKTLYIDAFAMGAWIGGLFTYEAIKKVADKGYSLSIITPGIHKQDVINAVMNLSQEFDQTIIGCYPPMMKDILVQGESQGINWSEYDLGLIFSAEGFGEEFRDHIHEIAGIKDIYTGSLNHFGTVDQGTLGHETPVTTFIRRNSHGNKDMFKLLFNDSRKQPTIVQYLPELFYFESENNKLICSSYSGLPLLRYDLKDSGGILKNAYIENVFKKSGRDFKDELKATGISNKRWNLPFVYVTEREDFSVKLAGGMIYPEEIRKALLHNSVSRKVTGKFTMEVINDKNMQPKLIIHVEQAYNLAEKKGLSAQIQKQVVAVLLENNSEYVSNYKYYGRKIWPKVILWAYDNPTYFSGKGKQKWVKK